MGWDWTVIKSILHFLDDSDNDGNNNSEEEVDFFEFNPHDLEGNDDSFNKTTLIKKEWI